MNDDDYRIVAKALFETRLEARKLCAQLQGDYGKWLTSTICALNFGAIYLITTIDGIDHAKKFGPIMVLIVGLCCALLCGIYAWINWNQNEKYFQTWEDPKFLVDRQFWPIPNDYDANEINRTYRASIILGVTSIICIPISAIFLFKNLGIW